MYKIISKALSNKVKKVQPKVTRYCVSGKQGSGLMIRWDEISSIIWSKN